LLVTLFAYRFVCMRDNATRDKLAGGSAGMYEGSSATEGVVLDKNGTPETDLTDKEDPRFRYSY
jgi:hypothetical protein